MDENARKTLSEIGSQLDQHLEIPVYNGGIVKPSDIPVTPLTLGKGDQHVRSRQSNQEKPRRSKTRPRQGPAPRQGTTNRSRASGQTRPIIGSNLLEKYEEELGDLQTAYPGTKVWHQAEGLWLLSTSELLSGSGLQATFLTAMPYIATQQPKSWGFWTTAISANWIGPRHTNFPDGSVCAFEPSDDTWLYEDGILTLLDQYTLWAARHLYLKTFDRWPGRQVAHHPYERITEFRDNEYCGCLHSDRLYEHCCKESDSAEDETKLKADYVQNISGFIPRKPPASVTQFIHDKKALPNMINIFARAIRPNGLP